MHQSYRLTAKQVTALLSAIQAHISDEEHYFNYGSFEQDYGDSWPEVARDKSETFTQLGNAALQLGSQWHCDECLRVAGKYEELAKA